MSTDRLSPRNVAKVVRKVHITVLSTNKPPVAVHLMRLINYLVTATTGYCISTNKVTF